MCVSGLTQEEESSWKAAQRAFKSVEAQVNWDRTYLQHGSSRLRTLDWKRAHVPYRLNYFLAVPVVNKCYLLKQF